MRLVCHLPLPRSWGPIVANAWARGRSSTLRGTARGCFAALCSTVLDCSLAPLLCMLCFEIALLHFPPPLMRLRCAPCLGRWALLRPLCDCVCALRRLDPSALSRSSARCVVFQCYCAASSIAPEAPLRPMPERNCWCSPGLSATARCRFDVLPRSLVAGGAPLLPMPGPVGTPPPFVRLLPGTLLPLAPPLVVPASVCGLSFDGVVVPRTLLRLRLRCLLSLGLSVLLRLLFAGSWALYCLVLRRSRLLLGSVRRPSSLPRCLLLWCLWGCADTYVWARGCSSALCVAVCARFAALFPSAMGCSSAVCVALRCYCAASSSIAPYAPLSRMLELTGAPPPLVRRLVGALLLVAPPLLVATPLQVPSSEFHVLPPAPLPWALQRSGVRSRSSGATRSKAPMSRSPRAGGAPDLRRVPPLEFPVLPPTLVPVGF